MPDHLTIIHEVQAQHRLIRENIEHVEEAMSDLEMLFSLQRSHASWSQSSVTELPARQEKLSQNIATLESGMKKHFDFEEKSLPPIFGEVLVRALVLVHHKIGERIRVIRENCLTVEFAQLPQEGRLAKKSELTGLISGTAHAIQNHASDEEVILKLAEEALSPSKI